MLTEQFVVGLDPQEGMEVSIRVAKGVGGDTEQQTVGHGGGVAVKETGGVQERRV